AGERYRAAANAVGACLGRAGPTGKSMLGGRPSDVQFEPHRLAAGWKLLHAPSVGQGGDKDESATVLGGEVGRLTHPRQVRVVVGGCHAQLALRHPGIEFGLAGSVQDGVGDELADQKRGGRAQLLAEVSGVAELGDEAPGQTGRLRVSGEAEARVDLHRFHGAPPSTAGLTDDTYAPRRV